MTNNKKRMLDVVKYEKAETNDMQQVQADAHFDAFLGFPCQTATKAKLVFRDATSRRYVHKSFKATNASKASSISNLAASMIDLD